MVTENPRVPGVNRIHLLKVPLDILEPEQISDVISGLLESGQGQQIVLLSLSDLLRARRNNDYRAYVTGAALVLPISKSLVSGSHFLCGKSPVRYMPFDFTIKVLTSLEERGRSLFLLGGSYRGLQVAERNLKHTFPGVRLVGRCPGGFRKQDEVDILTAVRKSAPSLLLVAEGVVGEERWIARNKASFSSGIQMWCSDLFDVFAERKTRPSKAIFDRGFEGLALCFRRPWRIFRLFPWLYYKYLLVFYKLFRRG